MIQLSIELSPNKEHVDRLIEGLKDFLSFFQKEDESASIMPRIQQHAASLTPLRNTSAKDFPSDYLQINRYVKVTNAWILSQAPIDKETLRQCLATFQSDQARRRKGKSADAPQKNGLEALPHCMCY